MKYLKAIGSSLLYMLYYFILQTLLSFLFILFETYKYMDTTGIKPTINYITDYVSRNTSFIILVVNIIFIVTLWLFFLIRKKSFTLRCDFKKISFKAIILCAIFGLFFNIFTGFMFSFIDIDKYFPDYNSVVTGILSGSTLIVFISTSIGAPFAEEILFRGLVFKSFKNAFPFIFAVILQGVLFGAYHMNLFQGIYASILGIVLGFVMHKYGSIWASIIVHAFYNFTNILLYFIIGEETLNKLPISQLGFNIIGSLIFVVIAALIMRDNSFTNKIKN